VSDHTSNSGPGGAESPEAADARQRASFGDHTRRAFDAAHAPQKNTPVRRLVSRLVRAGAPRQPEFNVEASTALQDLTTIIGRLDLRVSALEADATKLWGEVANLLGGSFEGADSSMRAMFASHDVLLSELSDELQALARQIPELADTLNANVAGQLTEVREQLDASRHLTAAALTQASGQLDQMRGDLASSRAQVDVLLHDFRDAPEHITRTAQEASEIRVADTYARFEERFRGSRDAVKQLMSSYDADIEGLGTHGPVVDIGSGRGEWLEMLRDGGVDAYGVDSNETFVDQCHQRGLDVKLADALAHLAEVPAGSLGAVTGFHIAEHLPVPTLIELLDRCMVALAPGGRILFETPNPTNILVGAASFYLDPTHLRPLHPDLFSFLVSDRGFVDVEVRFLHPSRPDLTALEGSEASEAEKAMRWAMFGPQDVSVLATKPGRGSN
jgi:SAM-dependent methyltransferase